MTQKKLKVLMILILLFSASFTAGFSIKMKTPSTVYRVYLKGKSIGIIKSKKELEKYIDTKQNEIKKEYGVDKVYVPEDLDIVKEITFNDNIVSVKKIYNKIKDISPFSIKGYKITIRGVEKTDAEGKKIQEKNKIVYVLEKETFVSAVDSTVKSFIPTSEYESFANETQTEIEDTGKIIEKIYLENKITIKKQNIPVNEKIYKDKASLSQYLLFGTTEKQQEYTVQDGDTISDIAFNNKMSTEEFLIANPSYSDENSLLSPGQIVTIGILNPQFNVIEEDYVVSRVENKYTTEVKYNNDMYYGYSETTQHGINGENRVTQRIQKINGETKIVETLSTEVLKQAVPEIIVKGGKKYGAGYGSVVQMSGQWGWPATCSTVSSPYGWRWGTLHDGTDIAGCGEGSYIFAAQSGVVVESKKATGGYPGGYGMNGEYIIIDHQNGYYTIYAHMCPGCRYVKAGDTVEKGQPIGGMGRTGLATGVHLHYGMWSGYPYRGGRALNAMQYY